MSDFLIYAARLQDAGIAYLSVRLHTRKDRTRMMRVTPHGSYPTEVHARWPWRDFELCGTDRVLESVKDDMLYGEGGPTAEKVQSAIDKHPLLRDDLAEWFADYLLCPPPTDEEIEAEAGNISEGEVKRFGDRLKHMLRGIDIVRQRDASQKPPLAQGE